MYTQSMHRFSRKLLCLWIALLVALSPLQAGASGLADALGTQDLMLMTTENTTVRADLAPGQTCDECKTEQACFSYDCTLGQCANCVTLLPPSTRISRFLATSQIDRQANEGPARLLSDSLFRPPKI